VPLAFIRTSILCASVCFCVLLCATGSASAERGFNVPHGALAKPVAHRWLFLISVLLRKAHWLVDSNRQTGFDSDQYSVCHWLRRGFNVPHGALAKPVAHRWLFLISVLLGRAHRIGTRGTAEPCRYSPPEAVPSPPSETLNLKSYDSCVSKVIGSIIQRTKVNLAGRADSSGRCSTVTHTAIKPSWSTCSTAMEKTHAC